MAVGDIYKKRLKASAASLGTGTPSESTFLRGDGSWEEPVAASDLSNLENTLTMIAWDTYSADNAFDDIYVDDFTGGAAATVDVTTSQISTVGWEDINSVAITQTTPTGTASNSAIYHAVSFDNAVTYKKYDDGSNGAANIGTNYATPVMTSNSAPSGTVSADNEYSASYAGYSAFNQNTGNSWQTQNNAALPHWIKYDFGSGNGKTINKYNFYPGYFSPLRWKIQGSNDDSSWTDLDTTWADQTYTETQGAWQSYFTFTNSTAYRYYRMYITQGGVVNSSIHLNELKLVEAQSPSFVTVAYNNSGTWQYNNAGSLTNASTNSLAGALSQSTAQSAYQWTKTNIEAMSDSDWNAAGGWSTSVTTVDWAKVLVNSAPENETPTFTKATINYDYNSGGVDSPNSTYIYDATNGLYYSTSGVPLSLISNGWEASVNDPTAAYCVLDVEPVDAITLNTDLLAYATIDNGAHYEQITLESAPFREIGDHDYVRGDLSSITARTDKTIRIKITSANSKALKCHAWAIGVKY